MFINENEIKDILVQASNPSHDDIMLILAKSRLMKPLSTFEVAQLIQVTDSDLLEAMYEQARAIKQHLYGKRVVLFAPLYVSDFCVNNCTYCGYRRDNTFDRKKLTKDQLIEEVRLLEAIGHKRLALEVGEDNVNYSFEDILKTIDVIYESSDIRRINVNIAPVSVEEFSRLKDHQIGTYILFQETYHQASFESYHPKSLKGNYQRQLYAHHKAFEGGIEDVGGGVLFGLYDYKFEVLAMFLHNLELEKEFGVGFHTVSVPRLKKADGMELDNFDYLVDDEEFIKIVAVLRLAIPYVGIILSTRENAKMRQFLIDLGITQISAGSQPGVGAYKENEDETTSSAQFEVSDERSPLVVIKDLVSRGYLPSYCTACYRTNRTGETFMNIVKEGKINLVCHPNALLTFAEYVEDYGDVELKEIAKKFIEDEVNRIEDVKFRNLVSSKIDLIRQGERDLYV